MGSELGTIVRGPLLITDIIGFHVSWGFGDLFGVGPLRAGYLNRQRIPGFYNRNHFGVPDAVQRCHWESEWAWSSDNQLHTTTASSGISDGSASLQLDG